MDLIKELKTKASEDKTFNAVCHLFAIRERSRREVTAAAIRDSLNEEGFKASISDVERVLGMLAGLGLGTVKNDAKGRLRALTDVRIQLQSIGKAAIGEAKGPMPKNRPAPQTKLRSRKQVPMFKAVSQGSKLSVTVHIGNRSITLDIPASLVKDDIHGSIMEEIK